MNCIDVLRCIIQEIGLQTSLFTLIEHSVGVNWRVKNDTVEKKLESLREGLEQQEPHNEWRILGQEILSDRFHPERLVSGAERVISVASRVAHDGMQMHLAIMNLHPEDGISRANVRSIVEAITEDMPGYLLMSGRYYHFYGKALLTEVEWLRFLAQFLMPTVIVSPRFIGHSLYRGYATLRLTTSEIHKPMLSEVCEILGDER